MQNGCSAFVKIKIQALKSSNLTLCNAYIEISKIDHLAVNIFLIEIFDCMTTKLPNEEAFSTSDHEREVQIGMQERT